MRRRCRLYPPQDEGSGVRRAGRLGSDWESEESRPRPCHWKRRYHHTPAGQEDAGRDGLRRSDDRESGIGESLDIRSERLGAWAGRTGPSLSGRETENDSSSFHAGSGLLWREMGSEKISEARLLVYKGTPRLRLLPLEVIRIKG